ncbi:MAG: nickel-dependent hydrogenase large subunit [Sedimentisphaerales bacterium]|nr:nickel-dependent hydrogenase large subunit [Sedimentisphaerales bacterium]
MGTELKIHVHHVTRIEGHGNIVVEVAGDQIRQVRWEVPEAPRFFEAMVRGQHFTDIQTIVSRICGICSITHSLAATKAVENAMGIEVSIQTDALRILMHYSEQLQSHILHIGYLAAPDFFGVPSVVPLASSNLEAVKTIVRLHRLANQWSDLLAGRTTHPVTLTPGGLTRIPNAQQLRDLQQALKDSVKDLMAVVDLVAAVADRIPRFERPTEYVSLRQTEPPTYTFYHGQIGSTDCDGLVPIEQWHSVANEYVSEQSTAKWCRWHRDSYAVGALARFNNNADLLSPLAKEVAARLGLVKGCCNPYMNTVAQLVECAHVVETSIQMIHSLLTKGIRQEKPRTRSGRAGKGVGCVEAPRGILFHEYEFDKKGRCVAADICIPTGQNHANIQKDMEALVPQIMGEGQDAVRQKLLMLVRAYDPCISCSTHAIEVRFI